MSEVQPEDPGAPQFLANPNAPWDSVFMLPSLKMEEWFCWHYACLIPNERKSGKKFNIGEEDG